jgi:hypothetical protein
MKRPILCSSNASLLMTKLFNPNSLGPTLKVTYGTAKYFWNNLGYLKYTMDHNNIHMERNENEHLVDFANNLVTIPG